MAVLPYVTAPGNIEKALRGIKSAQTPESVSQDFVKTILKISGGSGNQITAFLKKIGFANTDGTPSDIYRRFRNNSTAGKAAAEALKVGYAPLYVRNEYMHELSDDDLRGLIIEETGQGEDSSVVGLVLASIKAIKKFANWSQTEVEEKKKSEISTSTVSQPQPTQLPKAERMGIGLSYTINLNLPATSDIAVFNAIFKSLKENLMKESDDES
ncbi:MAG: DUF5343 domain-containing protein [bacterium]|nr:DUF5343 domain-containing protein [bacterium]